jgi:hypothetical protein
MLMNLEAYKHARQIGMGYESARQYAAYVEKKKEQTKTGRSAKKDSTKTKVYEAEYDYEVKCSADIGDYLTKEQAVKYVKRITKSQLWAELTGGKPITVSFFKELANPSTAGLAFGRSIKLAPSCITKHVILHELTHCAGHMHHDVEFRKCLVRMVSRFIGRRPSNVLKNNFKNIGLKMSKKKTILSPEAWLASKEKMKRLREMKAGV